MNGQNRDPFDDYEDEDEFLTFDARDEQGGSNRGPLIIAGVVVLLFLFAIVAWTLMSGRAPQAPSTEIAANETVAEDMAATDPAAGDPSVLDLEPAAPDLELEPIEGAEDPLLAQADAAVPAPAAAPAPAPARAPAPSPAPAAARPAVAAPAPKPATTAPRPAPAPARTAATPAPRPATSAPAPSAAPTRTAAATPPAARPAATPAPAAADPAPAAASGGFQAQLGSFQSREAAEGQLARYRADGLVGTVNVVSANLGNRGTWYRIRATGFANRSEAQEFCGKATAAGAPCIATSN